MKKIKTIVICFLMAVCMIPGCCPVFASEDSSTATEKKEEKKEESSAKEESQEESSAPEQQESTEPEETSDTLETPKTEESSEPAESPAPAMEQPAEAESQEEESEEPEHTGILTPEGNLDLVDDVAGSDDMQFMTVQSRDGSVFYIIIDRSSQSRNVYFLNQVDAADLLRLMNEEEKDAYEEETKEKEKEKTPEVQPAPKEELSDVPEAAATAPKEGKKLTRSTLITAAIGGCTILVMLFYYFLKIRPARNGSNIDRMEFSDDEYVDDGEE